MGLLDRVFNWSTKVSEAAPLIWLMYHGQQARGVWTKRNFAQYSDDAYKRCVIAYAAIRDVSRGCAKIPLKVMQGGEREVDAKHPLKALLNKPNPRQSCHAFREAVISYLMLSGNTYIEGVGPDGKPPMELWTLRPDRTKVIPGPMGPAGYTYEVNGILKKWEADPVKGTSPVLHMLFFNPLDDWYGMSPIEAAAYAVDGNNMAGEWNQGLLQNGCRPSGALVYKPDNLGNANLTKSQRDNLKEELNSAYAGTRNAGRPMILEGNLDWKAFSLSPAEMDWINGKNCTSREIALALGEPPMMLGIPGDNTYSNYQEARQAFTQETLLPLNQSFVDSLNMWLAPLFGDDLTIVQDDSQLPALAAVREKRWADVTSATWMTTNEKRLAVGMPIYEEGEDEQDPADEILIPATLVPLSGLNAEPPGMAGVGGLDEAGNPIVDDGTEPGDSADGGDDEGQTPKPPQKSNLDKLIAVLELKEKQAHPPEPITSFDVPYGAGMSYAGDEWYIDKDIKTSLVINKVKVNLIPLWHAHELREHEGLDHDEEYPQAHKEAEGAENALLKEMYPDVKQADYDAACEELLSAARSKAEKCSNDCAYRSPPRLDHRQYQEECEIYLLHLGHES